MAILQSRADGPFCRAGALAAAPASAIMTGTSPAAEDEEDVFFLDRLAEEREEAETRLRLAIMMKNYGNT